MKKRSIKKTIERGNITYTIVSVGGKHGTGCCCHDHYEVEKTVSKRVDKLDRYLNSPDEELNIMKIELLLNE